MNISLGLSPTAWWWHVARLLRAVKQSSCLQLLQLLLLKIAGFSLGLLVSIRRTFICRRHVGTTHKCRSFGTRPHDLLLHLSRDSIYCDVLFYEMKFAVMPTSLSATRSWSFPDSWLPALRKSASMTPSSFAIQIIATAHLSNDKPALNCSVSLLTAP